MTPGNWNGPGYSSGEYIQGYSQRLASCLRHSARITLLYFDILLYFFPTTLYFSPTLLQFSLTFCSHFHTFDALFQYFFRTLLYFFFLLFHHFFRPFSLFSPILCKIRNIFSKKLKFENFFGGNCNSQRTFSCYNVKKRNFYR